jgi:cytochrome c5
MAAEKGLDGLVASAKKGKNGMPPNGADPSLNDDELKSAIVHMLGQVGINVATEESVPVKAEDATAKKDEAKEKPAVKTETATSVPVKEDTASKSVPVAAVEAKTIVVVATEKVKEPSSPTEPVAPNTEAVIAPTAPKAAAMLTKEVPTAPVAPTNEETQQPVAETIPVAKVATPITEESKLVSEPVMASSAPVVKDAKPIALDAPVIEETQPVAPTTPKVEEAKPVPVSPKAEETKPTVAVPVTPVEEAKSTAPVDNKTSAIDLVAGEKTYKAICFSCHDMAIANAPKPGDKVAWAARIAKGMDVLYNTALKGDSKMPAMPAKGGNPSLSDSDVKNAVSYMVELSK